MDFGFQDIRFAYPWALLLLTGVPVLYFYYRRKSYKSQPAFLHSSTESFRVMGLASMRLTAYKNLYILRLACISILVVAMARPQTRGGTHTNSKNGIDIILCVDVSASMLAEDFTPNRLEAAKKVVGEFINARPDDRLGLVIFSGESFTLCPLTTDHQVLLTQLPNMQPGILKDNTAIGMGLATSADRLRESKAKTRVIILLTDGVNNAGFIDPLTASDIAKNLGIRVYTVGVGSVADAVDPVTNERVNQSSLLDEKLLTKISSATGGEYFRAIDEQSLAGIYDKIDKLEKSKIQSAGFTDYTDEFYVLAFLALVLMAAEIFIRLWFAKNISFTI